MRARALLAVGFACAVATAGASAAGEPPRTTEGISWSLLQTGPHGRSLEIGFVYGGCERNPKAVATEQPRTVTITVTVEIPSDPNTVCPAFARLASASVALRAPLAGRRVLGKWEAGSAGAPVRRTVPRLTGLAAADARRVISGAGEGRIRASIHVRHGVRGLPRVIAQSPGPGAPLPRKGAVRLVVGER